jgi:hypothetical protein
VQTPVSLKKDQKTEGENFNTKEDKKERFKPGLRTCDWSMEVKHIRC